MTISKARLIVITLIAISIVASCAEKEPIDRAPRIHELEFEFYDGELPSPGLVRGKQLSTIPEFLISWEHIRDKQSGTESGQFLVTVSFIEKIDANKYATPSSQRGRNLYLSLTYPDGEHVNLLVKIPAGVVISYIRKPVAKILPWRPREPKHYQFHFLYETQEGVYEYKTTYGFNRLSWQDGYFRLEGESFYLRGAYDPGKKHIVSGEEVAFFKWLKETGFNLYITNSPISPTTTIAASEVGMLVAWLEDEKRTYEATVKKVMGREIHPSIRQSPAWLGRSIFWKESMESYLARVEGDLNDFITFKGWDAILLPACQQDYEEAEQHLYRNETSSSIKHLTKTNKIICLAYFDVPKRDCPTAKPDLYTLINLIRRQEWCAGFIIPLDLYNPTKHRALMTDDFLIFDYEGFPLEKPLRVKRGSTIHLPLRYANFKPTGDLGGTVYWLWRETGVEGRVDYPEPDSKGFIDFPELEIPAPIDPGTYELHFEVIGWEYNPQAINWLDVIVE